MSEDDDALRAKFQDGDKPMIVMKHERAFCALHGEPYRANYPGGGYAVALIELFQAACADERTWNAARELRNLPVGAEPSIVDLEPLLDASTACCRVPRGVLRAIYVDTCAKPGRCRLCRRKGPGTPFTYNTPDGVVEQPHVCVDCVLDAFKGARG